METTGQLKKVFETQSVSEKFKKREFVLTLDATTPYPQHVAFQVTQDKCAVLDQFKVGDELKVQLNLRGREWTNPQGETKYFNTLEVWRIEKVGAGSAPAASSSTSAPAQSASAPAASASSSPVFHSSSDNDDLPF